jgi:HEPN domain-containing protein
MDEELDVSFSEDDCHLLDSIYLPSKYPLGEALPEFAPNEALCRRCLSIAERVMERVAREWG